MGEAKGRQTDAASLLSQGDDYLAESDHVNAAMTYLTVLDVHPTSPEAKTANSRFDRLAQMFKRGEISPESLAAFEANLPPIETLSSLYAKYQVLGFHQVKAEALETAGDIQSANAMYGMCMQEARSLMDAEFNNAIQAEIAWRS